MKCNVVRILMVLCFIKETQAKPVSIPVSQEEGVQVSISQAVSFPDVYPVVSFLFLTHLLFFLNQTQKGEKEGQGA